MNWFRCQASAGSRWCCLKAILVVIEAERHKSKELDQKLIDGSRASIVVVYCRDKAKWVTDHNEESWLPRAGVFHTDDRELAVLRQDSYLAVSFALIKHPSLQLSIRRKCPQSSQSWHVRVCRGELQLLCDYGHLVDHVGGRAVAASHLALLNHFKPLSRDPIITSKKIRDFSSRWKRT